MMKKMDLERLISLYVDGELDPRQSIAVSNLIQSNETATDIFRDYNRIREMFGALKPVALPENFSASVMDRIKKRYPSGKTPVVFSGFHVFRGRRLVITIISGASVVCLIAFVALWLGFFKAGSEGPRTVARVMPTVTDSPVVDLPAVNTLPEPSSQPASSAEEPFIPTPPVPLSITPSGPELPSMSLSKNIKIALALNSNTESRFSGRLLKICSERGLSFEKSAVAGREHYEFHLNRGQFDQLVRWLEKQTDLVSAVTLPEEWASSSFAESEIITVTFEVTP